MIEQALDAWKTEALLEPLPLYRKIPKDCLIEKLVELFDGEPGEILGYFARGHWEKQSFAIAVNREYELAALDRKPCIVSEVEHGYYTPDFCDFGDTEKDCLFFSVESQDSDSFPVTVWEV